MEPSLHAAAISTNAAKTASMRIKRNELFMSSAFQQGIVVYNPFPV